MGDPVKVVLDGMLFAECELHGANRDGMMRLTEDITDRLVEKRELDIAFASTLYINKYDKALKKFIAVHYPDHTGKIFSRSAPFFTDLLCYKELFKTKLAKLPIRPFYKEINGFDVFHSFYYPFPRNILQNRIKRSITYLDIIPLKLPGYSKGLVKRTADVVDSIASNYGISISEFSKNDLLNFDRRIDPEKVFVVPLAASKELFYPDNAEVKWRKVKTKYNLPEHYFLSVSGSDLRKNIPQIIKSFNRFVLQEKHNDIHLVLTGNASHSRLMLDEMNLDKSVRDRITIPAKFIDSQDLAAVYSHATCFFFMSLYEGFGLPPLEAMQCGVPVVVSNTTSLPEVVGDAGILLPPTDTDALCETMTKMYSDDALRKSYSTAGLERAAMFSWQRCADEYAEIFKKITSIH